MKEQLPKFLQYFYPIPALAGILIFLIVGFFALMISLDNSPGSEGNKPWIILSSIIAILSLIAFILKTIADSKIKKFKLGINPQYLIVKHPNNLEAQTQDLLNQKFELKDKTSTTAHLEKRPDFHIFDAIVYFLLGVLPGVLYLLWYYNQPKEVVYLDLSKQK